MSDDAGTRSPGQDSVRFGPLGGGRSRQRRGSSVEVPPSVDSAAVESPSDEAVDALDAGRRRSTTATRPPAPASPSRPMMAQATPVSRSTTKTPSATRRRRRTCACAGGGTACPAASSTGEAAARRRGWSVWH